MRILLCVKQVLDVRTSLTVDRRTNTVTAPGATPIINRADLCALEAAMSLKERTPSAEVIALSIGPANVDKVLRYCLARGVDSAWRIWDEGISIGDPYLISQIIAQVVQGSQCSLLLCGMVSEDSCSAVIPAFVAQKLNWPWVNRVVSIKWVEDSTGITTLQRGEKGSRLEIFCNLPAVLAFYPALSAHQYISLRRLRLANGRMIQICNVQQFGLQSQELNGSQSPVRVVKVRQPKPRTKRTAMASQQLSGEELMWQMISGPSGKKDDENLLRGEPEKLAERILNFLTEKGIYHPSKGSHKESNKGDSKKK
jgi:electron transfer flavoprotein beta subunit